MQAFKFNFQLSNVNLLTNEISLTFLSSQSKARKATDNVSVILNNDNVIAQSIINKKTDVHLHYLVVWNWPGEKLLRLQTHFSNLHPLDTVKGRVDKFHTSNLSALSLLGYVDNTWSAKWDGSSSRLKYHTCKKDYTASSFALIAWLLSSSLNFVSDRFV